jgi:hypothetical protein
MQTATALGVFARDFREDDLIECLSINPARMGDELTGRERAIQTWKKLIRSRAFSSTVIAAARSRILGFGAAVFVSQAYAEAELSDPRPSLNSRIIASIDRGCPVVLNEAQLRSANTRGGLDMVILYGSWHEDVLNPEGVSEVGTALAVRFLEQHDGYRINRLMTETVGAYEADLNEAMHVWRAVSRFDLEGPARSLWVITRDDALGVAGSLANPLFHHRDPLLQLRDADQELLLAALEGLTDEELCAKLSLSVTAIKKRWISIFERTVYTRPDLFPEDDHQNNDQKRGRQKRHHVLAYVRAHPEELRLTEPRAR